MKVIELEGRWDQRCAWCDAETDELVDSHDASGSRCAPPVERICRACALDRDPDPAPTTPEELCRRGR